MSRSLIVGPFPSYVKDDKRQSLLHYFGAKAVKTLEKKRNYICAIFNSTIDCERAIHKLHQKHLFGRRLIAKFADDEKHHIEPHEIPDQQTHNQEDESKRKLKELEINLCALSSKYDFTQPISPKLKYIYPPPSPSVLVNIAHTLIAVPKFYTQVLHLMNKMNLRCPFGVLTPAPPLSLLADASKLTGVLQMQQQVTVKECKKFATSETQTNITAVSDSESEWESDSEILKLQTNPPHQMPSASRKKRILPPSSRINKRPKLNSLKHTLHPVKPPRPSASLGEAFEGADITIPVKLMVKVQSSSLEEVKAGVGEMEEVVVGGFGKIDEGVCGKQSIKSDDKSETPTMSRNFITIKEIEENRVVESDWPLFPVFKNYRSGDSSCKLYIKNLAKGVVEDDLKFVFGRYLHACESVSGLHIRLMKEGRMKGQAFVTFPSEDQASRALKDVNGFILKDKPMVVVFGRMVGNPNENK